jgi:streptothricin acetyltransferase
VISINFPYIHMHVDRKELGRIIGYEFTILENCNKEVLNRRSETFSVCPSGMHIDIKKLTNEDLHRPVVIDGRFLVDSVLRLHSTDSSINYSVIKIPPYEKRYGEMDDLMDWADYVSHPDRTMYVALAGHHIVGFVAAKRNWNQMAYVEDIQVDKRYRGHGLGRQLMNKIKEWAVGQGMVGMMLETQNNNVRACKFYERYGFVLGGFDQYVYRGIKEVANEIALYWYFIFDNQMGT